MLQTSDLSQIMDLLSLTAELQLEIHGWVNTTKDVKFTYGFEFEVDS